jgi:hypothetical protein
VPVLHEEAVQLGLVEALDLHEFVVADALGAENLGRVVEAGVPEFRQGLAIKSVPPFFMRTHSLSTLLTALSTRL